MPYKEKIMIKMEDINMAYIFNESNITYKHKQSPIPEIALYSSERLSELVGSKHLFFHVRSLDPGKYSYPYHFHRNAEELFVILSGRVMLRTPKEFVELNEGDVVFFEIGPEGAHQLYNHTEEPCKYLDLKTEAGLDVCEYPDSNKVNIVHNHEIYEKITMVDYYKGEENVKEKWQH